MPKPLPLLPTTVVGSYPQPDWLVDHDRLKSQRVPRVRTPEIWPQLAEWSGGTNIRRRRLQPSAFLSYEMPVPSMATQLKLREAHRLTQALKARHTAIREANAALLPSVLERVFARAD